MTYDLRLTIHYDLNCKSITFAATMALQEELKAQGDYLFRYRSHLPLFILGVGLLVHGYHVYSEGEYVSELYKYFALGVALLGQVIRIFTVGFTPKHTSGRTAKDGQRAAELNTTGIYSTLRHPLYYGNFFMWLGVAMLAADIWFILFFVIVYLYYYERIALAEEYFLRNKFGETYLAWANQTPVIFPGFTQFKKAKYPFSLKKVIKKEKNGLAAIFILFWIFELLADIITVEGWVLHYDFWFYAAISSAILYLILKVLKKQKVFNEENR